MGLPLLHGKLLRKVALGIWFFSRHQRVIFMQQLEVPSKKTERDGASKTCDDTHAPCCQTDDGEGARDGRGGSGMGVGVGHRGGARAQGRASGTGEGVGGVWGVGDQARGWGDLVQGWWCGGQGRQSPRKLGAQAAHLARKWSRSFPEQQPEPELTQPSQLSSPYS